MKRNLCNVKQDFTKSDFETTKMLCSLIRVTFLLTKCQIKWMKWVEIIQNRSWISANVMDLGFRLLLYIFKKVFRPSELLLFFLCLAKHNFQNFIICSTQIFKIFKDYDWENKKKSLIHCKYVATNVNFFYKSAPRRTLDGRTDWL